MLVVLAVVIVIFGSNPGRSVLSTVSARSDVVTLTPVENFPLAFDAATLEIVADRRDPAASTRVEQALVELQGASPLRLVMRADGLAAVEAERGFEAFVAGAGGLAATFDIGPEGYLLIDGDGLTAPFKGAVTIGDDPGPGIVSLLHSGEISVMERGRLFNTRYLATTFALASGDRVDVASTARQLSPSGVLRTAGSGADAAFEVVVHSVDAYPVINRQGVTAFTVKATLFDRVLKNPGLQLLVAFLGLLTTIFTILEGVWTFLREE